MKIFIEGFLSKCDANLKRCPEAIAVDLEEYVMDLVKKEVERTKQDGKSKTPEKGFKRS